MEVKMSGKERQSLAEIGIILPEEFSSSHVPITIGVTTVKFGDCSYNNHDIQNKKNHELLDYLGASSFFKLKVRHGTEMVFVDQNGTTENYQEVDGMILKRRKFSEKRSLLISNTADCPIIVFSDALGRFISIVHSGWKGLSNHIILKAFKNINDQFLINKLSDIYVFVWPGICSNCYNVKKDMEKFFPNKVINNKLNLTAVIKEQLMSIGIIEEQIITSNYCSFCSKDNYDNYLFYSHRRGNKERNCVFTTFDY